MVRTLVVALAVASGVGPAAAQTPRKFAFVVGVNEYQHPRLPALKFAERDATALRDVLQEQQYAVTLLTGAARDPAQRPTRANVDARLKAVLRGCRAGDTVVVALAGHGLQFEGDKDSYFCPADARPFKTETATLVSLGRVYAELDATFAGVKVLLVDACRNDPDAARGARGGITADAAARPPKGVAALFSCSAGQRAFEHESLRHGVFFHHVLEGLRGKARDDDGEVTFGGLATYVQKQVSREVPRLIGAGAQQSPNLKADLSGASPVLARVTVTTAMKVPLPADPVSRPKPADDVQQPAPRRPELVVGGGSKFKTIADALAAAEPGATVRVTAGTYRERLVVNKDVELVAAGTRGQVVVETSGSDCLKVSGGSVTVRGFALRCKAAGTKSLFNCVEVRGGTVRLERCELTSECITALHVQGAGTDVTATDCQFRAALGGGASAADRAKLTLEHCDLVGSGMIGVNVYGKAEAVVRRCKVTRNLNGIAVDKSSIVLVEDTDASGNTGPGVVVTPGGVVVRKGANKE